jgi:4-aminobutyrate aminotransferase
MFAIEHEGIEPDIMLMAKGIAGGMPLSAFISRRELTSRWPAGRHGSTFGGNPVSCAAALATIEVLQEEKLVERSAVKGAEIMKRLRDAAKKMPHVGEIRGLGMMIGIEFVDEHGKPSKYHAEKVAEKCLEQKMIVLTCGLGGQVIRLIPPLNISDEDCDKALDILINAMTIK